MDLHRRGLILLAALALAAGCGSDNDAQQAATTSDDGHVVGESIDPASPHAVESVADPAPGEALSAFVDAARAKDLEAMWATLSTPTKERAGPTFTDFRARAGPDFVEGPGSFAEDYEVSMSVRVGPTSGVAAIEGVRVDPFTDLEEFEVFAAGAVKEKGAWKLEVLPPGALQLISPDTQVASDKPVVVVNVEAAAPIIDVAVWIDGKQYPSPTDAASETRLSLLAQPRESIGSGDHTLVAYAGLAGVGTTVPIANAWTFSSP